MEKNRSKKDKGFYIFMAIVACPIEKNCIYFD